MYRAIALKRLKEDEKAALGQIIAGRFSFGDLSRFTGIVDNLSMAFMPQFLLRNWMVAARAFERVMHQELRDELDLLLFWLGSSSDKHFDPIVFNHPQNRKTYEEAARSFITCYNQQIMLCGTETICDIQLDVQKVFGSPSPMASHMVATRGFTVVPMVDDVAVSPVVCRIYEVLLRYLGVNDANADLVGRGETEKALVRKDLLSAVLCEMEEGGCTVTGEIGINYRCSVADFLIQIGCATREFKQRVIEAQIKERTPERLMQAIAKGDTEVAISMLGVYNDRDILNKALLQALQCGKRVLFNAIWSRMSGGHILSSKNDDEWVPSQSEIGFSL